MEKKLQKKKEESKMREKERKHKSVSLCIYVLDRPEDHSVLVAFPNTDIHICIHIIFYYSFIRVLPFL